VLASQLWHSAATVTTSTLAIINRDGQNLRTTGPAGAMVKVVDGPLDGNRLVDIRDRCVRLEDVDQRAPE
jgi:hypothetical protein